MNIPADKSYSRTETLIRLFAEQLIPAVCQGGLVKSLNAQHYGQEK
jgi:hypothetical protein